MALRERTGATSWFAFLMSIVVLGIVVVSVDAYSRTHTQEVAELTTNAH